GQAANQFMNFRTGVSLYAAGAKIAGAIEDGHDLPSGGGSDGQAFVHDRVHDRLIERNMLPKDGDVEDAGARGVNQRRAIGGNVIDGELTIDLAGDDGAG